MNRMTLMVLVLALSPNLAWAEEIRFHNVSDHPVLVAVAFVKDDSVFGLENNGYDDPQPFTHVSGYREVGPRGHLSLNTEARIDHGGKTFIAKLRYLRVIVRNEQGQQQIVHPKPNLTPTYLPVHKNNGEKGWWFRLSSGQPPYDAAIEDLKRQGAPVADGMFHEFGQYRFQDRNGNWYYGVGAQGSTSWNLINEFFQTFAPLDALEFRVTNVDGIRRDFRLSFFDVNRQEWRTFDDWKAAGVGETVVWSADAIFQVAKNADNTDMLRIEGRDFGGNIITWGPNVLGNSKDVLSGGKKRSVYEIRLLSSQ